MAEYTEEEIEAREQLIEVLMDQARTGKKGIDLSIELFLQETKRGKAITETTKATKTLTGGFKDSAKALGTSTGNFSDLTSAVTGTIGAISGLLSNIPVVGKAFAALGDAAAETASFAIGQVQANYESFKELAKAGQIGADGVTGMADRFEKAGIPLATYTKLLSTHSEELAYFSSSAMAGGKNFADTIANMDGESKQYMRNLGLGIEQIGDAAIEYQVLQRKRGIMTDMDNMQLSKGTAHYVEELNMMAKLTGQNVDDLKKQRDEVRRDSRFRSRLAALRAKGETKGAEELENFAAMMMKINPEIGKGFTDITSGAINTEAALKLTRSGMLDTAKEVQRGLETGAIDKGQAMNMIIAAAKEASKYGGVMQSLAGLSEEAAAKFLNFSSTLDTGNMKVKDWQAVEEELIKTKAKPDPTTDKLSSTMSELERTIATVNKFFIATPAATDTIKLFAGALHTTIDFVNKALGKRVTRQQTESNKDFEKAIGREEGESAKITTDMMADQKAQAIAMARRQFGGKDPVISAKKLEEEKDNKKVAKTLVKATETIEKKLPTVAAQEAGPKEQPPAKRIDYAPKIQAKRAEFDEASQAVASDMLAVQGKTLTPAEQAASRELVATMKSIRAELVQLNKTARDQAKYGKDTAERVR